MRFERDPRDRYYRERLAGSTLASLILHALLAMLLFSVLASSSQPGATENVAGAEIVALQRMSPVALRQPAAHNAVLPAPHARVAPIRHAPAVQPRTQRLAQNRHELARVVPSAPPNPRPIPVASPQPNPQPTQAVLETQPSNQLPAVPLSIPTIGPVSVAALKKPPPSAAPSPAPTAAPSIHPSPQVPAPTASPTITPARPLAIRPSASPSPAAVTARVSAVPSSPPAPRPRPSAPPAVRAGVPSPGPTNSPAARRTTGSAPSPGPRGGASPGPHPGSGPGHERAPARPIAVPPTPSPAPRRSQAPSPAAIGLNARLRALIPTGPVHPKMKQYTPRVTLHGSLTPTPPPSVLARTKYLYDVRRTGGEREIEMWVTATRRLGPTTLCTGWLVRFPQAARAVAELPNNLHIGPANGTQVTIGGGGAGDASGVLFDAGLKPIVEGIVSTVCDRRYLVPYASSSAPSP